MAGPSPGVRTLLLCLLHQTVGTEKHTRSWEVLCFLREPHTAGKHEKGFRSEPGRPGTPAGVLGTCV